MSQVHTDGCGCSTHSNSTAQTLSELEFERGLWSAAIENDVEKVKKLLDSGHDADMKDNSGYTALHYAARAGHIIILRTLLSRGANPNSQTPGHTTALHRSAYMGHFECTELLLNHGAYVELIDLDGKSALHKCAERGNYKCAKLILDNSGEKLEKLLNMKDKKGNSAYAYADSYCVKHNMGLEKWSDLLLTK